MNRWEVLTENTCVLGECPVWDRHTGKVFWVDINAGEIFSFSPVTGHLRAFNAGRSVGCIALRSAGGLIAGLRDGFAAIDLENGDLAFLASVEADQPNNRFNDGKCDPAGRFWAGTMSDAEEESAGSLYTLEADHSVKQKVPGVTCSNGLAWSLDHKTLYYIDTPTRNVVAYDYSITDGTISNRKVAIDLKSTSGFPDGMTIDEEGMLWIAIWDGWKVVRYNPVSGYQLDEVSLPVAKVTCCVFGGKDLSDMYITSASEGLSSRDLETQPLAGSVFVIKNCGFRGVDAFEFAG